jgi:uncharacterized protein YndB with AHSA1/START domain
MRSNQLSYLAITFKIRGANIVFILFLLNFFRKKFPLLLSGFLSELEVKFLLSILPKINKMADKIKVQLEFIVNCSPKVLYNRLSTASGLSEWFAEDVRVRGKKYTFIWGKSEETAEMTLLKENKLVRFSWIDEQETYFEFRILQDELTGDVSLIIVDFAEVDEVDENRELWNSQVSDLKHLLGS